MPSLTRNIPHRSESERMILKELQQRVRLWERISATKFTKWREAEERTLGYLPERDVDTARRSAREGGLPQYTTIQIPYSYAVVMAAHTYLTSVFFGRDPIFQYSGRHGESQQKVQGLEALISYQVMKAAMTKYLATWLYDSLKYGVAIVGTYWDERIETITTIAEQQKLDDITGLPMGSPQKVQQSQRLREYAGNRVYNIQPQDFIWDVRYTMREFQSGEFCGERRKLAWNEIVRREKAGYFTNIEHIGWGRNKEVFVTDQGAAVLERPETLSSYADGEIGNELKHPMMVGVYQLVMEILPNEWKLGNSDWPEKWVFTCTDDFGVLIGAQPLGAWHCKYPYSVIPSEPEGYGLTTRGLPEVLEPVQNTIDWLVNTHFYNVRATLNDRVVVDPSMVVMKDVLDPLPGKVVRLRPEGYGRDPKLSITQFPVSNVTQAHMNDIPFMFGVGERIGGVNDQIMGMLAGGGRKTATEVRTSTSFGINRLKTTAEFASACGFDPLSMMMVQNTQQYYDMELEFKIAGDLLGTSGPLTAGGANPGFIQVTPDLISGFYDFVPVDGTMPIDRFAQVQLWEQLMTAGMSNPQIGMGYDWAGIFQWVAQLAGLKNITQFKIQITPDEALMKAAALGNSVPLGGKDADPKPGAGPAPVSMPKGIMGAA